MVTVTVVVEEAMHVKIKMVPELEPVEEAVEHEMTLEMVKEASVVTLVATTTAGVVVLTSNTTVKILNTKKEGHNPSATITNRMGESDTNCFHYFMNQS